MLSPQCISLPIESVTYWRGSEVVRGRGRHLCQGVSPFARLPLVLFKNVRLACPVEPDGGSSPHPAGLAPPCPRAAPRLPPSEGSGTTPTVTSQNERAHWKKICIMRTWRVWGLYMQQQEACE